MSFLIYYFLCFVVVNINCKVIKVSNDECQKLLSEDLINEIASYKNVTSEIIKYVVEGNFKGVTYNELAKFVDKFDHRISGSDLLEQSIDYMIELTNKQEHQLNIATEEVQVPHWVRKEESVLMLKPISRKIPILGLGGSVSTPEEGITAEVFVVDNFDEFESVDSRLVQGKIVLFTPLFTTYGETVVHRSQGATRAASKGASACLIRSITPFSINSPHTGSQTYAENVTQIPVAAITLEDADLIKRMYNRGEQILLNIKMLSTFDKKLSRNTFIDLEGYDNPEKLVIVSGHIDNWDVGQGAMDDGGGLFISWAAPVILRNLNLIPKRTVRTIFWTSEELGLVGAYDYEKKHRHESDNINFIMESDEGTFSPLGLEVTGTKEARCIIGEILKLFESINASSIKEVEERGSVGSDIGVITRTGVPGAGLLNDAEKYFWFHHTEGDMMNVESPEQLDLCTAFWTAASFVIADLSIDIPR